MTVKIRLARFGAKKSPFYRIVVTDSRSPRNGNFLDQIGTLNPMVEKDNPARFTIKEDRVKYWIGVGATPTDRIASYLAKMGIGKEPKRFQTTKKHLPKAKAQERLKASQEKLETPATTEATTEAPAV